jgi:alpha-1,6-mannosyltransferase
LLITTAKELVLRGTRDFELLIAGTGNLRSSLEAEASQKCPGFLRFLGHIGDRQQLADLYANCDAFIHPNPSEPFGIAPLEAMASGLPLIAPNSGGLTTYANTENA